MNHASTTIHKPFIKSWFGFSIGLISVGISLLGLYENISLGGIISTLGFLCFWYPWSQMTHWNKSLTIKNFFKTDNQEMNKSSSYLALLGMVLLVISTLIRLIN